MLLVLILSHARITKEAAELFGFVIPAHAEPNKINDLDPTFAGMTIKSALPKNSLCWAVPPCRIMGQSACGKKGSIPLFPNLFITPGQFLFFFLCGTLPIVFGFFRQTPTFVLSFFRQTPTDGFSFFRQTPTDRLSFFGGASTDRRILVFR